MELSSKELALRIVKILQDKKARDVRLLHVEDQTVLTDYMIICEGTSNTQIKALAEEIKFVGIDERAANGELSKFWNI